MEEVSTVVVYDDDVSRALIVSMISTTRKKYNGQKRSVDVLLISSWDQCPSWCDDNS